MCVCVCRHDRDNTGFSFCLESEWAGGQKVDRLGKGLLQVWKRQIQQLSRVSPDMASAILGAYPSPQLLRQVDSRSRPSPFHTISFPSKMKISLILRWRKQ